MPARNKKITTLVVSGVIMAALVAVAVLFWEHLAPFFTNPDRARQLIADSGPWGPVIFMLLQLVQVVIAPIPGQVTGFVGGYLFGPVWGTIYATIGATVGFTLVFLLARALGRPFVEYFVDAKLLTKFDYLASKRGPIILFFIFLLPAFPDDIVCYIAGLTKIKIRTLIFISFIGRLPGNALLAITGAGVADANIRLVVVLVLIMLAITVVGIWQRKNIERWVQGLAKRRGSKSK